MYFSDAIHQGRRGDWAILSPPFGPPGSFATFLSFFTVWDALLHWFPLWFWFPFFHFQYYLLISACPLNTGLARAWYSWRLSFLWGWGEYFHFHNHLPGGHTLSPDGALSSPSLDDWGGLEELGKREKDLKNKNKNIIAQNLCYRSSL